MDNIKFDWDNISIIPSIESQINSRSEINTFYKNGKLPLMVAPMDTVVDKTNAHLFLNEGFEVCVPRGETDIIENCFMSVGLDEFIDMLEWKETEIPEKTLVDIAHGHMSKLIEATKIFKRRFPNKILMVGNIAHPQTYKLYSEIGVDYVRCGIGGGSACFHPDTKVITIDGNKKIKDIIIGDKVLTHNNNYKKVILKHTKKSNDLVKINGNISTVDHKYFIINKNDIDRVKTNDDLYEYAYWKSANEIDKENHLLIRVEDV